MPVSIIINKLLSSKAGYAINTPADAARLALDIEAATGERLGMNTIKRLTGILPYDYSPRKSTLEILARYLGYSSWESIESVISNRISSFGEDVPFYDLTTLQPDTHVSFTWDPDRRLLIRHLGEGRYIIEEAENSKLQPGDILTLSQIGSGFPFMVKDVEREGRSLGCYHAAAATGVRNLVIE